MKPDDRIGSIEQYLDLIPVASKNSVSLAKFALMLFLLYHSPHAQNHITHPVFSVEVSPCVDLGKLCATSSTEYITKTYEEAPLPESR